MILIKPLAFNLATSAASRLTGFIWVALPDRSYFLAGAIAAVALFATILGPAEWAVRLVVPYLLAR